MIFSTLDWAFVIGFFALSLGVGLYASRSSGKSSTDFFLSGRNMPWWLLGVSMVATTFSADTPNLVTDLVRQSGVAGNWGWWAFLLTGMLTVFVFARLWRRSEVLTDVEFYELRYSGKMATFLRGFRALYLGLIFNVLVMGSVSLAAVKFGEIMLGIPGWQILAVAGVITIIYSTIGGLKAVILTDFIQFILAMIGSIWACIYIINLPEIGGLEKLLAHENVIDKISLLPDMSDPNIWIPVLIVPLAVQWWASYYPGSEPGGGGYIVQRMLAAKNEQHAMGASLFFNIAHYALRPWPWILIAMASIVVYPDLMSLQEALPGVSPSVINDDLAYPAMMRLLPAGLIGVVFASLAAAFMSTISTHLNWGSSYLIHDVYQVFIKPEAKESELVNLGRGLTAGLMLLSALIALYLDSASQIFDLIVLVGAGTGLIYILRWFWWRINAYSEITAMVVSAILAFAVQGQDQFSTADRLLITVGGTTAAWLIVTFLTRPTDPEVLRRFFNKIRPYSLGWRPYNRGLRGRGNLGAELLTALAASITVYGVLFSTGLYLYGRMANFAILACLTILAGMVTWILARVVWRN